MGGLHPAASLYERSVNLDDAKQQHSRFRQILRSYGVKVLTVRGILEYGAERYLDSRVQLENLAMQMLEYKLNPEYNYDDLDDELKFLLSDKYKKQVLEGMSHNQLIDILMVNPTVELTPVAENTKMTGMYDFVPLSNLVYTRDQQITTVKGVVMGKLQSSQRRKEAELLEFCFGKIGLPVLGSITEGCLEGGDYFAAGKDLCFIGIGLRSTIEACKQLMDNDWLGTRCVAIVKDDFDRNQDRMHLDCVFNILSYDCCLMLEDLKDAESSKRRLVDEYVLNEDTHKYELVQKDVHFYTYVTEKKYSVITVTNEEQLRYGCNALNLGHGRILAVDEQSSRHLVESDAFDGTIEVFDFSSITTMYGAVHCSSQVLKRRSQSQGFDVNSTHKAIDIPARKQ